MTHTLPADAYAAPASYSTSTVTYLHATVTVYTPCPDGGSYVQTAECTHNHATSDAVRACGEKLRGILSRGRVPAWAQLH
jgi:ATP sulfurylase